MHEDEISYTPQEIDEVVDKSRHLNEKKKQYNTFKEWCLERNIKHLSENVLIAYFKVQITKYKSSTLWKIYSMLRTYLNLHANIDISKFSKLEALLKQASLGHVPKKPKIFEEKHINKFINEANDKSYLGMKVVLIIGYSGACTREELINICVDDIKFKSDSIRVSLSKTSNNVTRKFIISNTNWVELIKKYANLRPKEATTRRFFLTYRNGHCFISPIGLIYMGRVSQDIATYLKLPNPDLFTNHCFRRSSITHLANIEGDLLTHKHHSEWKSSVAESYVNTTQNKIAVFKMFTPNLNVPGTKICNASADVKASRCDSTTGSIQEKLQKAKAEAAAAAEGASSSSVENAAKTEIEEPIVIKEEGPDDDLNLILQCESVPDQEPLIEIKAEPVELKEEPLPETTQDFSNFNSTRIIRTYENTKNKNLDFSTRIIRTYENTKKKNLTVGDETQSKPDSTASNKRRNTEISECSNEGRKRVKTDETEICILCTKIFDAPLNDITTLETKILFTTNIHEHGMPKKACQSCFEMLDKCYKFKNQVMTAHTLLVDDFFATPMNIPRDLDEISSECDKDEEDSDEETLNYECIVCDSEFLTEKELNEHDVIIHAKLDCKICDFKATDLDKYLEHKKEHVSEETGKNKKFFCEQCGDLVTKHRYDAHILEHKSTKRIECAVCNISVPDTLLKLHMKKHESKFVCKKCGKHFGTQKILKAHTIIEHKRTFVCNICDRAFSVQTKLQQHIQLHTGEKPFACVVCDRRFNNRFNLATHTRIHTNTFPYKCNYCEESFRYNASRKDHQKKKHPEKLEEDMNLLLGEEKE